jgi:tetratricopeptide (TPR) repeat protein
LRAVFDYSWSLLTADERQILLRLSIFRGGFTRDAARYVAMADLRQLSVLVDRSLVQRTAAGRYTLHNVIRQYAAEQQQADPAVYAETKQRHSGYYLGWLAEQNDELRGPGQKGALAAVSADLANIRIAWEYGLVDLQPDPLRHAAFPLFYFFELRGLLSEGEAALRSASEALQQANQTSPGRAARTAICALNIYQAFLGFRQGKVAIAEALLLAAGAESEALMAESSADEASTDEASSAEILRSHALLYLGVLEWSLGRFDKAVGHLQNSMALAGQPDQARKNREWEFVMAQVYLGMVRLDQGMLDEARRQLLTARPAANALGDPRLLANALLISGRINLLLGQIDDAEQQLVECLEMTQETRDPNSITYALLYLGMVKQAQGDLVGARQRIEQSLTLYAGFNDLVGLERAWVTMGFLEIAAGNLEAAQGHFLSFLRIKQRTHSIRYILAAVLGMAAVRARAGDSSTALLWTLAVLQHQGLDWEARQRGETLYAELEGQLSPEQVAGANAQAASQSFDRIMNAVLSGLNEFYSLLKHTAWNR